MALKKMYNYLKTLIQGIKKSIYNTLSIPIKVYRSIYFLTRNTKFDAKDRKSVSKIDLFLLLDSHIKQHLHINTLMIKYHRKAFNNNKILLLNAPSLIILENKIYFKDNIFNFDYIINTARESESLGFSWYNTIDGVQIYSLISDTSEEILRSVYTEIASVPDNDLDEILARDPIIEKLVWVDLSLVLKNSIRDIKNHKQNQIIRLVLFHWKLILNLFSNLENNINFLLNNSIYSLNQSSVKYFKNIAHGTKCLYLLGFHEGYEITRFKVLEHPTRDAFYRRKFIDNYKEDKILEKAISFAKKFIDSFVFGSSPFKYSPDVGDLAGRSVHSVLDIDPNKSLYVYFTSSPDEELASDIMNDGLYAGNTIHRQPYSDELHAIKALATETRSLGVNLIVRFHPRLDIETRVPLRSDKYLALIKGVEKIKSEFSHVYIIEPQHAISSYWLAGWADKIFSLRSSMGNVLPLLGLPVVMMSDNRGSYIAAFESLIMKDPYHFPPVPEDKYIVFSRFMRFILGFYISNCFASFGGEGFDDIHVIELYRSSVNSGYSSLAFISDSSADFYGSISVDTAAPILNEFLIYLMKNMKDMSRGHEFPVVKFYADLLLYIATINDQTFHELID